MKSLLKLLCIGLSLSITSAFISSSEAAPAPKAGWSFKAMGELPIQAGGRVKPFDSYARDLVLQITGRRTFEGWDPVELTVSWLADPKGWEDHTFILINRTDVKRQLGLDESRSRFSPKELYIDSFMADYANSMQGAAGGLSAQATPIAKTSRPDARSEELRRLFERVSLYRAIVAGDAWQVIPVPAPGAWQSLALASPDESKADASRAVPVREAFLKMFAGYLNANKEAFESGVTAAQTAITEGMRSDWDDSMSRKISAELLYNRLHPYQVAWIIYLIASLMWTISIWLSAQGVTAIHGSADASPVAKTSRRFLQVALPLTILGFCFQIFGILLRVYIAGRPPVTNMYESIVWVSFGLIVFAGILWLIQKNSIVFAVATAMSAITLIVSDAAPAMIDASIHPLVPVLRSNYWLMIHVMTITLSYAAFALTLGLGNVALWFYLKGDDQNIEGMKKITMLNLLTYRAMQFGVVLLAAGTILGGVWADYSWGRFWGWDPKEVWALIALMGYLIVIHARFTGWMRPFGFAAWSVIAFTLVLMAWYGVNFVLGVGLHSYGFSSGGQSTVATFVLGQFAYVIGVAISRKRRLAAKSA